MILDRVKQRISLTPEQLSAILGLDDFLRRHGLILCCPNCTDDGHALLDTENDPHARQWKIDCRCRERRFLVADARRPADADGNLLMRVSRMLEPARLAIRCAQRKCVQQPLEIVRDKENVILTCRCAKTTVRPPTQTVH
jgi:hypothetical protein